MTQEEILEKIIPVIEDIFSAEGEEISLQTDLFEDLYADEMDIIELGMILEEEFDFQTDDELKNVSSVADLCNYVSARIG